MIEPGAKSRRRLDVARLRQPAALIFNPRAGQKLGLTTNAAGADAVEAALTAGGVPFEPFPTERARHATELAREAVANGRELLIAAGGDGTVSEVAQALVGTDATLGVMPLGSVMNVARTLCIPRDLDAAARTIREGRVLPMDVGRLDGTYFLEGAGVGLDAALFGYFDRLESGARPQGVLRGAVRFLRGLGAPRLAIVADGRRRLVRAPMVSISNGPYIGAAYTVAPDARVDDGFLDVVVYREATILRVLVHMAAIAGGRHRPTPTDVLSLRVRSISVETPRRRPLPVHADGTPIGVTPARCEVVPAGLRVIVGRPEPDAPCAWAPEHVQNA